MPTMSQLVGFALTCFAISLTPGPNVVLLLSRSVSLGPQAGLVTVAGMTVASAIYMISAVLGLTAVVFAIPYAYDALRFGGALYLLVLAWKTVSCPGAFPTSREHGPVKWRQLLIMGFVTNLLNPGVAVLYLSLLPQFVRPAQGGVLAQFLTLGVVQIAISMSIFCLVALAAGRISVGLSRRPGWGKIQRWLTATVIGGLALTMATEGRR